MIGSDEAKKYLVSRCPNHDWHYFANMDISTMCIDEQFICSKCSLRVNFSRAAEFDSYEKSGFTKKIIDTLDIAPSCEAAKMNWALE